MKMYWCLFVPRAMEGRPASPQSVTPRESSNSSAWTSRSCSASSLPRMAKARSRGVCPGGTSSTVRPSAAVVKPTAGWARATWRTASRHRSCSVPTVRRNLRRAGVLKKRLRTVTLVPTGPAVGRGGETVSPSTSICAAAGLSAVRERMESRETAAIEASASPRKPSVAIRSRSVAASILLVACGATARCSSPSGMPEPSSVMRTSSVPPCSRSTPIRPAPASRAFSISSFTTLAGRSTTSPAAIWLATSGERRRMGLCDTAAGTGAGYGGKLRVGANDVPSGR